MNIDFDKPIEMVNGGDCELLTRTLAGGRPYGIETDRGYFYAVDEIGKPAPWRSPLVRNKTTVTYRNVYAEGLGTLSSYDADDLPEARNVLCVLKVTESGTSETYEVVKNRPRSSDFVPIDFEKPLWDEVLGSVTLLTTRASGQCPVVCQDDDGDLWKYDSRGVERGGVRQELFNPPETYYLSFYSDCGLGTVTRDATRPRCDERDYAKFKLEVIEYGDGSTGCTVI